MVLAAATFGHLWVGKVIVIQFVVDNMVVVDVVKVTYSKNLHMMHLIWLLVFFTSKYNVWFHVPGRLNVAADALSKSNMSVFFMQAPQADSQPTAVAPALVSLLSQDITWTCKSWIKLFRDTLQQV